MDYLYLYFAYLGFALVPVFVWLFFYFKEDRHPEPKAMIFKIFILGMVAACVAALVEMVVLTFFGGNSFLAIILQSFLLIALVEEIAKYLVVKKYVFSSFELDEPLDVMLYMTVSALGFAAVENILLLFATDYQYTIGEAFAFSLLRFIGAVFLHTLTSGAFGFFIALAFCSARNKKALFFFGLLTAVVLHGLYNVSIIMFSGFERYFVPAVIILVLALFVNYGFGKLKKLKSICKISENRLGE